MIDQKKWEAATDEQKMTVVKVIQGFIIDKAVTKADNKLITDYLIKRCEREV